MVAHFAVIVEIVDVDIRVVVDLHVGVAFAVIRYGFYIYALKAYLQLISAWYDIHAEHKIQYKDDGCRHHIRPNEAVETHPATRSEEHTSELQSLMRNSYAVFCLKKTTKIKNKQLNTIKT